MLLLLLLLFTLMNYRSGDEKRGRGGLEEEVVEKGEREDEVMKCGKVERGKKEEKEDSQ